MSDGRPFYFSSRKIVHIIAANIKPAPGNADGGIDSP